MTTPHTFDAFLDLIKSDPAAALVALDAKVGDGTIAFPFGVSWIWLLPRVDDFLDCFEELDGPHSHPFIEMEAEFGLFFQMSSTIERLIQESGDTFKKERRGFPLQGVRASLKMASVTNSEALKTVLIEAVIRQFDGTWARFIFKDTVTK